MAHKLILRQYIDLPFHPQGDFDHGNVSLANGYVFLPSCRVAVYEERLVRE